MTGRDGRLRENQELFRVGNERIGEVANGLRADPLLFAVLPGHENGRHRGRSHDTRVRLRSWSERRGCLHLVSLDRLDRLDRLEAR